MIRSDHKVVKVKVPLAVHPLNQDAGDSVFVTLFLAVVPLIKLLGNYAEVCDKLLLPNFSLACYLTFSSRLMI